LFAAASGLCEEAGGSLALVPWPRSVEMGKGELSLGAGTRIVAADAQLKPLAAVLAGEIEQLGGRALTVAGTARAGDIELRLDASLKGEAYAVSVTDSVVLRGGTYQALAYASATFLQAVKVDAGKKLILPRVTIEDQPAAPYRGLMIDVARRNNSIPALRQCVVLCRLYKIRYLHLHLTDDQSWTFPSKAYPKLGSSNQGYEGPASKVYSRQDLLDLVRFADERGVTLVPEIDVPGHTDALRIPYPETFDANDGPAHMGVLDMANPKAYEGLATLIGEMCEVFKSSPYFHIGADEPRLDRCSVSPQFKPFLEKHGLKDEYDLYCYFIGEMAKIVRKNGRQPLAWGDFPPGGTERAKIPNDIIALCWRNGSDAARGYTAQGYEVVNATWNPLYVVNATLKNLDPQDKGPETIYGWNLFQFDQFKLEPTPKVLGAQICAWEEGGEVQTPALRKRVPAMSERVWSPEAGKSWQDFSARLAPTDERLSRLVAGFPVDPSGE
jgi:hexosaminidase